MDSTEPVTLLAIRRAARLSREHIAQNSPTIGSATSVERLEDQSDPEPVRASEYIAAVRLAMKARDARIEDMIERFEKRPRSR